MTVIANECRTAPEIIAAARQLLDDPARWTTDALARNAEGRECPTLSDDAAQWCAAGACMKAGGRMPDSAVWQQVVSAVNAAAQAAGYATVDELNDQNDHAAALSVLDAALVWARAAETGDEHAADIALLEHSIASGNPNFGEGV